MQTKFSEYLDRRETNQLLIEARDLFGQVRLEQPGEFLVACANKVDPEFAQKLEIHLAEAGYLRGVGNRLGNMVQGAGGIAGAIGGRFVRGAKEGWRSAMNSPQQQAGQQQAGQQQAGQQQAGQQQAGQQQAGQQQAGQQQAGGQPPLASASFDAMSGAQSAQQGGSQNPNIPTVHSIATQGQQWATQALGVLGQIQGEDTSKMKQFLQTVVKELQGMQHPVNTGSHSAVAGMGPGLAGYTNQAMALSPGLTANG